MDDLSSELGKVRNWGFSKLQRRGWGGENKGDVYDRVEWKTNDGASGWERVEGLLITVYLSEAGVNKEMNLRKGGSHKCAAHGDAASALQRPVLSMWSLHFFLVTAWVWNQYWFVIVTCIEIQFVFYPVKSNCT